MRHFKQARKPPTLQERFQSRSPIPEDSSIPGKPGADKEAKPGEEEEEEEEEEDDYMNMTFTETPTIPETSLQRRQRLHAEGLKRGRVPSKADLAAHERTRREEGLAKSLLLPPPQQQQQQQQQQHDATTTTKKKSKGLAMMAKMGFTPGETLGAAARAADAHAEPLRIEVRDDRGGLGLEGERKRKLAEAAEAAAEARGGTTAANKKPRVEDPLEYRDRMARERDAARKEALVGAAQKVAERMDEDREAAFGDVAERERTPGRGGPGGLAARRPLKAVPVVYRGLVKHREEKERVRRMRHDMETSLLGTTTTTTTTTTMLSGAKLPGYEDEGMDEDDKMAVGREEEEEEKKKKKKKKKKETVYMPVDDLDEEDEELDEWEALEVDERLERLVGYLRTEYRYCFWCKFAYPDEGMEGCPGLTEEEHD
ncbi:unnamed protein product [Discula destructiva]